jgi:hypothetical protein
MSALSLHLMTQRDQPYGSERRCCEICGVMLVAQPDSFWLRHTWTDNPEHYKHWPAGVTDMGDELTPCNTAIRAAASLTEKEQPQ